MNKSGTKENMLRMLSEAHKSILYDLCTLNNCIDCYNESLRKAECCPVRILKPIKMTRSQFYLETYDDSGRNTAMAEAALQNNYNYGFVDESGVVLMKFWKRGVKDD